MPRRTDIHSILIIGAGPIIIGQACEFDYSGAQACKALREEGYRVILVNSNPATIMTDPEMADVTYIEPITWRVLENIIAKERPDAVLPTMGGQTALNCALDLAKHGVLEKYGVEMIGASREAIDMAEDREKFKRLLDELGLHQPPSGTAMTLEEARLEAFTMGFDEGCRVTAQTHADASEAHERLTQALEMLSPAPSGMLSTMLSATVVRLVEQIVGEVEIDIERLVQRCDTVAAFIEDNQGKSALHLHPDDIALLEGVSIGVSLVPDKALHRGCVRLETADGWVEDGPDVRLSRLRALMDDMEGKS